MLHDGRRRRRPRIPSPRTTCAPSSSPRPRSTPASACSWISSAIDAVDDDPPGRRVRQPDRRRPRDGARADPGLRPRPASRRPATPPERARSSRCCRARRAREIETVVRRGREDRDCRRAAVPGAFRRRDGVPASDRAVPELSSPSSRCRAPRARRRARARPARARRQRRASPQPPPTAEEPDR